MYMGFRITSESSARACLDKCTRERLGVTVLIAAEYA